MRKVREGLQAKITPPTWAGFKVGYEASVISSKDTMRMLAEPLADSLKW